MRIRMFFSRSAREKESNDRARVEALRAASVELGLEEVTACSAPSLADVVSAAGRIHGFGARLLVGGRGWHQVLVQADVKSLPRGLSLGPRPTGRGAEDFHMGVAADSGMPRFDEHHAVFGEPDALKVHAESLDQKLLDFVADQVAPAFDLTVGATELRLEPGRPLSPSSSAHSLRWPCSAGDLARLWRTAEGVVGTGLERGVIAPPPAR